MNMPTTIIHKKTNVIFELKSYCLITLLLSHVSMCSREAPHLLIYIEVDLFLFFQVIKNYMVDNFYTTPLDFKLSFLIEVSTKSILQNANIFSLHSNTYLKLYNIIDTDIEYVLPPLYF